MTYRLLVQSGDRENLDKLLGSLDPDDLEKVFVSTEYEVERTDIRPGLRHSQPWNPSKNWNDLRAAVPDDSAVLLCADDVLFQRRTDPELLASLATASNGPVHASIVGNVIYKTMLRPYPERVAELVPVRRGIDIPLICVALPPRWPFKHDEEYLAYGRDDHDFWEAALRAGRRIHVSREVIVAHDAPELGTGRSVGRKPGGWWFNGVQVMKNDQRFADKWGYR